MCGIVAYVGKKNAQSLLLEGLKRLEYRGYDSAGICIGHEGGAAHAPGRRAHQRSGSRVGKSPARRMPAAGHIGMAHTRWATHGAPDRDQRPPAHGRPQENRPGP